MSEKIHIAGLLVGLVGFGILQLDGVGFDIVGGLLLFLGSLTALITVVIGFSGRE